MNKIKALIILALLQANVIYAQHNPANEILVFFKDGVNRIDEVVSGKVSSRILLKSAKVKSELSKMGIDESLIEIGNPQFQESDTISVLPDGSKIKQLNMTKLFRVKVPEGKSRQDLINKLNTMTEVLYAEPNGTFKHLALPSDSQFGSQWGLKNSLHQGMDIHAEQAWNIYKGSSSNIIAIIDGGTDVNHIDLNDKISGGDTGYGWDGHGIHVSGIAAAETNNSQGVAGVDWNAKIHAQRIDSYDDVNTYNAIVDAVKYSPNVTVLNHSWTMTSENGDVGRNSITVRQAFAYAYKANRTSIVAMGNHQQTQPNVTSYPAGFENVIAVGATDRNDNIANFSAQGSHIDVSAPGVNILSTYVGGGYDYLDGTSMAAPHVTGVASLLKGFKPTLENNDIENIIRLSADDLGAAGFDNTFGTGRLNADKALRSISAPYNLNQWTATGGTIANSTANFTIQIFGASGLADGTYVAKRHEVRKTITFPKSFCQITGVWGRGYSSKGWNAISPNYGEGFCEVVPGTLNGNSVTLRTYIYDVTTVIGQTVGTFPASPGNVVFAYSVLGIETPTNMSIAGPNTVCTSSTFTLNNVPPNSNFTWSVSPQLTIQSTSGNTVNVNYANNGNGFIKCTLNQINSVTCTAPYVINNTLRMGGYSSGDFPISGPNMACPNSYVAYNTNTLFGATNYNWGWSPDWTLSSGQGTPTVVLITSNTSGAVVIRVANACSDGGSPSILYTSIYPCGYSVTYSPNPVSSELTIQALSETTDTSEPSANKKEIPVRAFSAKLFDQRNTERKSGFTETGVLHLDVNDLPSGNYVLSIQTGEELVSHQVIIKR
jgi:hypothetical protein